MPQSSGDFDAGRRRQVFADRLEQLPDEAVRRPVGEADLAAGLADAQQLGRGLVLVGREHHAEGRDHRVEAAVGERQRLGVGLLEFDRQAFGLRARAAALEQSWHIVGRDDVAPAPRRGERDHSVAGGDVEHLAARAQIEGFAKLLADDLQAWCRRRRSRPMTRRPAGGP